MDEMLVRMARIELWEKFGVFEEHSYTSEDEIFDHLRLSLLNDL